MSHFEARPTALVFANGRRVVFRSRLEARWATYFEKMGFAWKYEPFRFQLAGGGSTAYTPDFEVEGIGVIEIKPTCETLAESIARIERYIAETGNRVHFWFGSRPFNSSLAIIGGDPMRMTFLDGMQSTLVLCGTQRHDAAKQDFSAVDQLVRAAIWQASEPKFLHDAMTVGEILTFADERKPDAENNRGNLIMKRLLANTKEQAA